MLSLPLGAAGRQAVGLGRRLLGADSEQVDSEMRAAAPVAGITASPPAAGVVTLHPGQILESRHGARGVEQRRSTSS